jgi:hypothetical protein
MRAMLLLLPLLTGCITQYVRPDTTDAQRQRDQAECSYEARKATAGILNSFQAGWEQGSLERQCMSLRGYEQR